MTRPSNASVTTAEWDWNVAFEVCLAASRRILGAGPEAEDAAQDAVIRAWRRQASCDAQSAPAAWWAAIARREALRRLARAPRSREVLADEPRPELAHTPDLDLVAERLDVQRALASLAGDERALLDLRYRRDLTQPEVAGRLGIAEGTAKVRLHRVRERLRQKLSS